MLIGKYFISNIDGEIHNLKDIHNYFDYLNYVEIENNDGEVIDTVTIYDSLDDLLNVINS